MKDIELRARYTGCNVTHALLNEALMRLLFEKELYRENDVKFCVEFSLSYDSVVKLVVSEKENT